MFFYGVGKSWGWKNEFGLFVTLMDIYVCIDSKKCYLNISLGETSEKPSTA